MLPPYRPATPQSTHSWWSDRNPLGPNLSIHAAAKPLVRFMYRKQVRSFIKKNQGIPLSSTTMDIYLSYLAFRYISHDTKISVLNELNTRVQQEKDARVVQSLVLEWDLVADLLNSSDPGVRRDTCNLLGTIAASYAAETWSSGVCGRIVPKIVSLLSDVDTKVRESAAYAAAKISKSPAGAHAVGAAKIWDHFPEHLNSVLWVRIPHDMIVQNLVAYAVALLGIPIRPWLQTSSGNDIEVQRNAVYVLSKLSCWLQGVQAVVSTRPFGYISNFLGSSDTETRRWSCEFVGNVAYHWVSLGTDIHLKITSLLGDEDEHVREAAAVTISRIVSNRRDAISRPEILKHFVKHLDSPDPRIRQFICIVLAKLFVHLPTPLARLDFEPTARIVHLLSDTDAGVRRHAAQTLSKMSFWRGATEAFDAPTIQLVLDVFKSTESSSDTRIEMCEVLSNLAFHSCPLLVQLGTELYARIVFLVSSAEDACVRRSAFSALHEVTGSGAVEECTALWEYTSALLDSSGPQIRQVLRLGTIPAACVIVER
ncbi:armadillo-type protein [Mycena alexandri]|uniref:non-specific serine/threonine protein kinase n=1 Tax=Mycena alexandri TaxID=1745969 RepID=A0AAD6T4C0_9AGAR|nr:armadillo-type protein [Mycena alexandri]